MAGLAGGRVDAGEGHREAAVLTLAGKHAELSALSM